MRRIAVGMTVGLAVWFGSAVAAEAQWIQPTGPLSVVSGATSSTFTATVSIPTPMNFAVKVSVYKNGVLQHCTTTSVPNPGTNTYYFSKVIDMTVWAPSSGDTILYVGQLLYNRVTYTGADWTIIVPPTRPSKTYQKSGSLALQSVDRDRRRE
jgi:hypothetical protein